MKNLKKLVVLAILATFASCATNNDVVSDGLFQKRKYRKGVYFEKSGSKGFDKKVEISDEITQVEEESSEVETFNTNKSNEVEVNNIPDELTSVEEVETESSEETIEAVENGNVFADGKSTVVFNREIKDVRRVIEKKPLSVRKTVQAAPAAESGAMLILLILLCLIIPPLAIGIYSGITTWFWIDLLLFLLAIGFFLLPFLGGAGLAAVVIALLVIFDVI